MGLSLEVLSEARAISVATLEMYGVHWENDDGDYNVRVPFPNKNGIWYERKMLAPGVPANKRQKVLSPSGSSPHLYNPARLGPNAGLLFFCEGEYDTLSVLDCGWDAIGTQGTGTFNKTWARLFVGSTNVIAFDGDAAGRKAAFELQSIFRDLGNNAHILDVPDGRDLNDLHQDDELEEFLWRFVKDNNLLDDYTDTDG